MFGQAGLFSVIVPRSRQLQSTSASRAAQGGVSMHSSDTLDHVPRSAGLHSAFVPSAFCAPVEAG